MAGDEEYAVLFVCIGCQIQYFLIDVFQNLQSNEIIKNVQFPIDIRRWKTVFQWSIEVLLLLFFTRRQSLVGPEHRLTGHITVESDTINTIYSAISQHAHVPCRFVKSQDDISTDLRRRGQIKIKKKIQSFGNV